MLGFARHLPKFGWRSAVVAPPRLGWEPTDEALLERVPPETSVYHVPYPDGRLWKPLRWTSPYGIWLPLAWAGCRRAFREQRPDAILTSGPPHHIHLLGCHLRRWRGIPWVADFRDPWAAGDPSTSAAPRPWEIRAEATIMRHADAIVANTPSSRERLASAYPQHAAKMVSITNGYDPENYERFSTPPPTGPEVNIIHPGQLYAAREPGPFLEAIRALTPEELPGGRAMRVRFIGCIEAAARKLDDQVRTLGLEKSVSTCSYMPHAQSLLEMTQSDVLLLLDSPGRRAGVPAKLFEYIGAGRPILALAEADGDVAWVLQESGVPYRIAPPRDPEAIRRALLELLADPGTAERRRMRQPPLARFTREHVTRELADLLETCLERRAPRTAVASAAEVTR
jgi:glycosyltransferase involved in cell wall biosynthesis